MFVHVLVSLTVFARRAIAPLALVALLGSAAPAAVTPLTPDDIFAREPLTGRVPANMTWSPDGTRLLYTLPGGVADEPLDTHVLDVATGRDRIFVRAKADGHGARPAPEFVWSPDSTALAYLDRGDLYTIARDGTHRRKLATDADDPQWSPNSAAIAYVHDNDIYTIARAGCVVRRVSFDGADDQTNGEPDWVYSEELDMRHAFRWSPDGKQIAYLHADDRPVTAFPIVDFVPDRNRVHEQRYPLAGGRNPVMTYRVATLGAATRTLYTTATHDDYLATIGFAGDGRPVATVLDRAQQHLAYIAFGAQPQTLYRERSTTWIDLLAEPRWLANHRQVVMISQRDGEAAGYVLDARSGALRRLTRGLPVTGLAGIDNARSIAYFEVNAPTRRDATLAAVPLAGGAPRLFDRTPGAHRYTLAPNARAFVAAASSFGVPPVYALGTIGGSRRQVFVQSRLPADRAFGQTELVTVPSPAGPLDAYLIRPPDFDPAKTYPVVTYVYGGPASPTTRDEWGGSTYLFHQALAQRGIIVFSIDGPGSQTAPLGGSRRLFRSLGPASLAGQLAGARYLATLPYVDTSRIGIWGWSFGGYETTYALTHAPAVWKAGFAVAPVTDWAKYDSIYTERYMGLPQHNAAAYRESSSVGKAAALRGRLMIAHGTSDDNVHFANTVAFVQASILAGRPVDLMFYPRKTHGISGIPQRRDLFGRMLRFWTTAL